MPSVVVNLEIEAPASTVWKAIKDVESYPKFMDNVLSVEITETSEHWRDSRWSTTLKGSVLEWTEREVVDDEVMTITFHQLDGDLDKFDGSWQVKVVGGQVLVSLEVEFEIGIPLLADMLDPVAKRALRDNSEAMLRSIELQVLNR